ncbi:hypothetical protein TNCV_1504411 [Trichonephila clavipes]|uniref:Uncharacterized protein n=1 Tax=Trichonephila clavipes TaxID=2585209 RepID=A0A8X6RYN2_TRICX|nr:hypothetical protein TNCV_1504411 [Trichonephila clavipes]
MNVRDVQMLQLPTKTSPKFTQWGYRRQEKDSRGYEERFCHRLNLHLGIRKLPLRWVPRSLTSSNEHFQRTVGAV